MVLSWKKDLELLHTTHPDSLARRKAMAAALSAPGFTVIEDNLGWVHIYITILKISKYDFSSLAPDTWMISQRLVVMRRWPLNL